MALQKEITFDSGLETTAYYKVLAVGLDYTNKTFNVAVGVYLTKAARDAGKSPLQIQNYNGVAIEMAPPDLPSPVFDEYFSCAAMDAGGNVVHQAYEFLKSLAEFQDAIDI